MAPPIPGLRRAIPVKRRTAADVAGGILAILALAVLILGVPVALVTVLGLPIPHSRPTLGLLSHQLSILNIIQILSVIVWLAWLQLVFCVLAEIRAAIRNVGVPARIPLSGGTQAVAHRLVTAALLLVSASAALSPAFARSGPPPRAAHTISATDGGGSHAPGGTTGPEGVSAHAAEAAAGHSSHEPHVQKIYIVKPPVGRFHESLWEIAENHLGNGLRYREIFAMNEGRMQPDGTRLTIASLIRPGWILRMPRDAYGPGIEVVSHAPGGASGAAEQAGARQAKRATPAATGTQGSGSGSARDSAAVPGVPGGEPAARRLRRRPASHGPEPGPGRVRQRAALLPLRALGRIAARRGGSGRARPAQARAALAACVRSSGRYPGRRRGPGRGGAAARRERALGPAARHRAAVAVTGTRRAGQGAADGVRRAPRAGQPRPVDRAGRQESAAAVAVRGRRPGVAAAAGRGGRPRPGRGRGRARPLPGAGLDRHQRHRPDARRPRGRAGADRGARVAPDGAGGARRDGRGTGHQPVVGPDADNAGRLRS